MYTTCPRCGKSSVFYRSKTNDNRCIRCGNLFTKEESDKYIAEHPKTPKTALIQSENIINAGEVRFEDLAFAKR